MRRPNKLAQLVALVVTPGVLALPLGCVTSTQRGVDVASSPKDDPAYAPVFERATQSRVVHNNFETRYRVSATYLSPEFRSAFAKRREEVYKADFVPFEEAQAKAGFIVSIHTPDAEEVADLENPRHWTVLLTTPQGAHKPVLVKPFRDKEGLRAFFPTVDEWTTEYLIVFDVPSADTASPALVEKMPIKLTLANADAKVDLAW